MNLIFFEAYHSRERARGAERRASKARPIPLNTLGGRLHFGERDILTFPPLCPLPLSKGGAFYFWQKNNRRSNLLWQGPRGERKGKALSGAVADCVVANPQKKSRRA